MPVSPKDARKLANERMKLVEKIDEAIIAEFPGKGSVIVYITEEDYKNRVLCNFITKTYEPLGWKVDFSVDIDGDPLYFVALRENK